MLMYGAVLAIPLLLAWSPSASRGISIGLLAYFLLLLVFIGLRYEIGPDWHAYLEMFLEYQYNGLAEVLAQKEPGFFALNKVSELLGYDLQGVIFVCALLFLVGVFAYAAQTASAWIALGVVTPSLIFVIGMSGIRQGAAIGIIYFLLARWTKFSFMTKVVVIVGAGTIHNSALFALLLLMIEDRKRLWAKIPAIGLLAWYLLSSESLSSKI